MTTVFHRAWSIFFGVLGVVYAIDSFSEFSEGNTFRAWYKGVISLILLIHGLRSYKVTWTIKEEAQFFTIRKNQRLFFQGSRNDLVAISSDCRNYFLTPTKGRVVKIPREAANQCLFNLIGENQETAS